MREVQRGWKAGWAWPQAQPHRQVIRFEDSGVNIKDASQDICVALQAECVFESSTSGLAPSTQAAAETLCKLPTTASANAH